MTERITTADDDNDGGAAHSGNVIVSESADHHQELRKESTSRDNKDVMTLDCELGKTAPTINAPHRNWCTRLCAKLGQGVRRDVNARKGHYLQDWREISKDNGKAFTRIAAASVYIFFASALPAIAFGQQLTLDTKGQMGIYHTLMSTGMCGVIQSVIGGQPLLIVGVAEPIVIIYHFMHQYCTRSEVDLVVWSAWACVWAAFFLVVMSVTNVCNGIKWFTRFCGETFGMLIAILFLQQAIKGLVEEFNIEGEPSYWKALNGVFGLLLAFLYVWSSHILSKARTWTFGLSFIRAVLADYGFAIMIVALSGLSFTLKGNESVPQRIVVSAANESTWITSGIYTVLNMASISGLQIVAAIVPGFVISILFYFDHSVSSQLAQQKEFNVKRPSAYHYDLLLLAFMTILCGLLGLPPVNGVLPQAPLHTKALCSKLKIFSNDSPQKGKLKKDSGKQMSPSSDTNSQKHTIQLQVYENRISNFTQAALCLVLFGIAQYVLKYIPTSIIWAFFAFMSLESLPGNQLWDRLQIILSDPKRRIQWLEKTHCVYLETVDFPYIILFTVVQFTCLMVIWAITVWSGLFGISFPLWIMALVPLRAFLLPKFIKPSFLADLDSDEVKELPPGSSKVLMESDWFPEEDEDAQELLDEFMYGRYYTTFRHLLDRSQLKTKLNEQQLKRRHSIDIPHNAWHKRSYTDLNSLDGQAAAGQGQGGKELESSSSSSSAGPRPMNKSCF